MVEKNKKCKKVYINGMHCVSCESIVSDELKKDKNIKHIDINCKKNDVLIHFEGEEPSFDRIKEKIEKLGYKVSKEPQKNSFLSESKATAKQWFYSLLIVVGIIVVYKVLKSQGKLDWAIVDTTNITIGIALLIGLVASVSSCLAVVGGVVVSFAAKYKSTGTNFYQRSVKPHLLFHLGRIATFFILGGLLGTLGSLVNLTGSVTGWVTFVVAVIMIFLGLNILGLFPSLSKFGIRMPKKSLKVWDKLKLSEHKAAPLLLGAFTFFLPCGFTQSMQLFAVASGSFVQGALAMMLFALGTAPVLIGIGVATSRFKNMKMVVFQKVAGFIVIIFAFYTLTTGLALVGINVDLGLSKDFGTTLQSGGQQIVDMTVSYKGYSPNVFTIEKDVPVKWIINVEKMTGCTNEIIIPDLKISKPLEIGENIIEFTPTKEGDLSFSCWMGMVRGKFIVKGEVDSVSLDESTYQDDSLNTSCGASTGGECGCGSAIN